MTAKGTYVYCVISSVRPPRLTRAPRGLPGTGAVRLLDVDRSMHAVVTDVPLEEYGEESINAHLSDLDWVSRAAVAHERVVEHFIDARAVLPMKLFTIFTDDDRALQHLRADRQRLAGMVKRVANHQELGVRVLLDRARASAAPAAAKGRATRTSGLAYLSNKKAQRDAAAELASRAQTTVTDLYDRLAGNATLARRRSPSEMPVQGGSLLIDAAFLVPRSRAASFRSLVAREARKLAPQGYAVVMTGPWPPYTFVRD
jgi:Gas vesicle synthesis protein GvpL/GvpF